jgi:hypothetical protein
MFVMFGFDDNGYADGVDWFLDVTRNLANPDGSLVRATFFHTAAYGDPAGAELGKDPEAVKASWLRAIADGHEVGNHTWSHPHGSGFDLAQWTAQIGDAQQFFVDELGVPAEKLYGFRTPYLEFGTPTFDVLSTMGMRYDTSIEFGYDWFEDAAGGHSTTDVTTGQHYPWPFTLDSGNMAAYGSAFYSKGIAPVPGMWEIPVYTFTVPVRDGGGEATAGAARVTGFDFNLFKRAAQDATVDPLDTLIFSFEQRRIGNRSPFAVGTHTDYYSASFVDSAHEFGDGTAYSTHTARRQVIEAFIQHVLQYPEVRIVPMVRMLAWMNDPTPL